MNKSLFLITASLLTLPTPLLVTAAEGEHTQRSESVENEYVNFEPEFNLIDAESTLVNGQEEIIVSESYAKEMTAQLAKKKSYTEIYQTSAVAVEYRTKTVTPTGQLSGGKKIPNGGGFFVQNSGGGNVSFSTSLSWGPASVSVSQGSVGTTGTYVSAPSKTAYYKVKIDKKYKFTRYKVNVYDSGVYKYTYYTTGSSLYSESLYCVKA